jgi:hypothetical protein
VDTTVGIGEAKPMSKKKKGKKHKKRDRTRPADEMFAELGVDPARAAGYERLIIVEERLYQIWEQRSRGEVTWAGEALGAPVDETMTLWLAAIGDKVAALGGHLELNAVFPDETVTLLLEPGLHPPQAPGDT